MESLNFELLLKTVNESDLGIVLLDADSQILLWNDWMADYSGKQASQVIHHSLLQVCPEINGSRTSEAIVNALKTGQPAVISNVLNRTPFNLYPKNSLRQKNLTEPNRIQQALKIIPLLTEGKSQYCLIQISDVSASVKRENALEQQIQNRKKIEQVLSDERALFIAGPTVVLTWTARPEPKINYISPNVELMLGYKAQQFTQAEIDIIGLMHPKDVEQFIEEIEINSNNDSLYFEQEFRLINAKGEYRWLYSLTTINRDFSGDISRYLGYLLDITERKQAEESLIQANLELEEFAYRTSHDLRSPLISSIKLLEIIDKSIHSGNEEKALKSLALTQNSLRKLEDLVQDILSLAQTKGAEEFAQVIDIELIINEALEKFRYMDNFTKFNIQKDLTFNHDLVVKASRFILVVENLISNAIKYQNTERDDSFVKISTYQSGNNFILEVRDNGLGIPKDQQDKLFEMFKRFHSKVSFGSGLGLYMIKKSAIVLNGEVSFQDPGEGSIFRLSVPYEHRIS